MAGKFLIWMEAGVSTPGDLEFFKGEKGDGFLRILRLSFHICSSKLSQYTISYKSGNINENINGNVILGVNHISNLVRIVS